MPQHKLKVEELKTRLDKYLAQALPAVSRSQIQRDIEAGRVEVNSRKVFEAKFVVRLNDRLEYNEPIVDNGVLKPINLPLKVLYNQHGLLVIDKPAGLVVHPGAGFKGESLASALLFHFKDIRVVGEDHRPGIVHRLDKDTSGVILVAKTPEMYEYLKDAFAQRKVRKEYLALVLGRMAKPMGSIDSPIGKNEQDFRKMAAKPAADAKPALTEYRVIEELQNPETLDFYSLIKVKLHTGRTHQIRVHLASLGHPLVGDELYGGKKAKVKGLARQFLHAKKIEVRLPDETWIEAESELADDLKEFLKRLNSKIVNTL
ncbi:MAG: RluA family pseudouridine synthase [Patescibacteria group bacterium]|nr:RluA family pseudouridine synthase [Patescibacteria group bacterium]